jgi:Lrp/AsnC family transcriptional regulator, leucine-responsive regulatory protein
MFTPRPIPRHYQGSGASRTNRCPTRVRTLPLTPPIELDRIGWQLLNALQQNARATYSELARTVGLSVPSVIERIRKLEEARIISGYHAQINTQLLRPSIKVMVRFEGDGQQMLEVARAVQDVPEVIEAHRMTGDTCFMAFVQVDSMEHLERLLDRLSRYGRTYSSVIVSTPVQDRPSTVLTGFPPRK